VTEAALHAFTIDAFERGEIDPEAFDHEAHVYMAWLYLERFALPAGLRAAGPATGRGRTGGVRSCTPGGFEITGVPHGWSTGRVV
jgi:hypothetical protein